MTSKKINKIFKKKNKKIPLASKPANEIKLQRRC